MKLFVLALFFSSFQLLAANNVRLPVSLNVTASRLNNFASSVDIIEELNGNATEDSSATKLFVPLQAAGGTEHKSYFTANANGTLPENRRLASPLDGAYVKINFKITTDSSTAQYVRVAVRDGDEEDDDFILVETVSRPAPFTSAADSEGEVVLLLERICSLSSSMCDDLDGATGENEYTFKIFVYLSTESSSGHGSVIQSGSGSGEMGSLDGASGKGIYFDLSFSDKVPKTTEDRFLKITEVKKGDTRMTLVYEEQVEILQMISTSAYKTVAYRDDNTCGVVGDKIGTCNEDTFKGDTSTAKPVHEFFEFKRDGEINIKGLQNDVQSCFVIALMNKYGFVSAMSNLACSVPRSIEVFIEEMQCYLLSAGFGEEHYVIDYFRSFRDRILLKNSVGKLFVNFYYKTAPSFAPYIYKNKVLSFLVKGFSFVLYFIFNYLSLFIFLVFLILGALIAGYYKKFRI